METASNTLNSKPSNHGALWTPEQDTWLLNAIAKNVKAQDISIKMSRTYGSIISRLKLIAVREITNGKSIEHAMALTKLSREAIEEFSEKQKVKQEYALAKKMEKMSLKNTSKHTQNTQDNQNAQANQTNQTNQDTQNNQANQNTQDIQIIEDPVVLNRTDLNVEQELAIEAVERNNNILITGSAGSGKSFVVKYIIQYARESNKIIGICAMTGSAAVLIGGTTLHSFMGIGLGTDSVDYLVRKIRSNPNGKLESLTTLQMLIIDEVSMLNDDLLTKISQILSIIRKNPAPFGGVQMILVGDPFQLCPIDYDYFFNSPEWTRGNFKVILLKLNMRQAEDDLFKAILDRVRWGVCSKEDYKILKVLRYTTFPKGIIPTRLYSHNKDVDTINNTELNNLITNGAHTETYNIQYKGNKEKRELGKKYAKAIKLAENITLCKSAQVVLTRNIDMERGLVNGARGTIISVMPTHVMVNFKNAGIIKIDYYNINSYTTGSSTGTDVDISYIPLKLAWALSIHSSQGMTLDALEIDLGSSIFAYGQAYTGLSRARNMTSIKLVGLLPESFKTSPQVIEFYSKL